MLNQFTPIVRGQCTSCGYSRNLWVNELNGDIACNHRDRGCTGEMKVAYAGPKGLMPSELEGVVCSCSRMQTASRSSSSSCSEDLNTLCEMGFDRNCAARALAHVDAVGLSGSERLEAALDFMAAGSNESAAQCAESASQSMAAAAMAEECECAICTEELEPASAAMRCSGEHGKRHYYHASCLSQWIQQCRNDEVTPTCPECRGPLQVRAQRLNEFLAENSSLMDDDKVEALRAVHDAALSESDDDGWAGIKTETLLKGIAIGAGVAAVGIGIAAVIGALNKSKRKERD